MATLNGAVTAAITAKATAGPIKRISGFPNHRLNVKVELLLNGTWTDITRYVLVRDDISISPMGRTDETSQMDTSSMSLTLKNTDGRFTPDNSSGAYYPYVQLNTQIRVSVADTGNTGVTYSGYRFWGEVSEWPPQWDPKGADVYCQVTASGIWRRISQRTKTLGSPYTRFNNNLNSAYNLAAYWPMEDGTGSQYFATTTPSTASVMTMPGGTNAPTLASVSGYRGSDALPVLNRAELDATVSTSSSPTTVQFRFCLFVPSGGDTGRPAGPVARLHTSGTVATVDVKLGANGTGPLNVVGSNGSGTQLFNSTSTLTTWGVPLLVVVNLTQSGSNILWTMNTILPGGTTWNTTTSGSVVGTVSDATSVIFNPGGSFSGTCVGQAAVYYGNPPILSTADALNGWVGENAMNRFTRICAEEGIPVETIGSSATTLGAQSDDTISNVLQEIETTDGGLIYETRDQFGLGYRSMASLQNQSAAVTLDYNQQQVGQPLQPVNDDAMVRNDITLTSNYDGYSVRVYLANGARSLQNPPNGVGTGYEASITVNGTNHTQINNLGIQLLNCGTVATSRYPTITVNLARTTVAPLFAAVPSLRQGDFLKINNMPAFGGLSTQNQLVWGWTETINNYTWTLVFNTIPEAPWESSFNPGTSVTGTVPASPTTQSGAGGAGSVTSAMIADGAIVGSNLASDAVNATNIALGAITNAQISSTAGITAGQVSFTASQIGGITSSISNTAPSSPNVGDLWFDGSNGYVLKQWNGTTWAIFQYGTGAISAGSVTTAILAAGAVTASTIAAGAVTAGKIAAGTIFAGIVDGTLIQGATLLADGSSGEILVYAGTPATGNLIGSWSAVSGTDGNSNTYNAGLWIYDSGGNSMGLVPGGSGAASQLAFSVGSGTPTPPSGCSGLYGAGSGQIQYVDAYDGSTYGAGRRSLVSNADQTVSSSTFGTLFSSQVGGTSKKYRIHGVMHIAPVSPGGNWIGFQWIGPSGASGNINFLYVQGTSVSNSGGLNAGNSSGGVAIHLVSSPATAQTVYIDGSFSVTTLGTFAIQAAIANGGSCLVRAFSSVDIMPV